MPRMLPDHDGGPVPPVSDLDPGSMLAVTGLYVYPLKGGRALAMEAVELDRFGPTLDRRWMVVDDDGALVTQREVARLCLVSARPENGTLRIEAPDAPRLAVRTPPADTPPVTVRVWKDRCEALDCGPAAATWFSRFLGQPSRLMFMPEATHRRTDPTYDPAGAAVSFADAFPLLIVGESSLAELNRRLPAPLPMSRFRPNVVIGGADPFAEDGWRRFRIGDVRIDVVKPCARCVVTTVDQDTGSKGKEPLRALASFRKAAGGVMFGMNAVHRDQGRIRVGQAVELA